MIPSPKHFALLVPALLILGLPACTGLRQQESAPRDAEQQIKALEQRWLENEGTPDVLESVLADDFVHVLTSGFITKREQVDYMRKHPQGSSGSRRFEQLRVRVYGATAIANGIVAEEPGNGQRGQRTAFTDVFVYRDRKWAAVNAQELPLKAGDAEGHDTQRPEGSRPTVQPASPPKETSTLSCIVLRVRV